MKKILSYVLITMMVVGTFACKSKQSVSQLDWPGTYYGTIPCADCPGINVEITLDSASTYTMKWTYVDRGALPTVTGKFSWSKDASQIHLEGLDENDPNQYFRVEENQLVMLGREGQPIESSVSDYTLKKVNPAILASGLTGKRWKLIELDEKPVHNTEAFIAFQPDSTVNGNLGCNSFTGHYTLDGEHIQFGRVAATRKMCLDMQVETGLTQVLNTASSYTVNENHLILHSKEKAAMAKFEAQ
jgi:heat shock protein HslJ